MAFLIGWGIFWLLGWIFLFLMGIVSRSEGTIGLGFIGICFSIFYLFAVWLGSLFA